MEGKLRVSPCVLGMLREERTVTKAFENPSWITEDLRILEITFSLLSKARRLSDCFFSLLLSFSSNQTTQCVIRHLFLLTPQVLRDVTASLCYRCSHSCFRRILVSVENQTLRRSTFSISPNGTESKDRKSENLISERRHFLKENEGNRGVGTCFVKVHTHCSPFGLLTSFVIRLNHSVKTSLCVTPLWPRRWPQWVRSQPLCSQVGKL